MQNKIVISIPKGKQMSEDLCGLVRITPEAESILRRMCRETGVSMKKIASAIIEQSAESVEFVTSE